VLQNAVAGQQREEASKQSLFFTQSHDGQKAAAEFLLRLSTDNRTRFACHTRDIVAQVTAITSGHGA